MKKKRLIYEKYVNNFSFPSHIWYTADKYMNIYRGCSHGCIYCDSRSDCYGIRNRRQPA